jgi:SAM-dependent methyltransferase
VRRYWERQGRDDPMWGVLTRPERWGEQEFFSTGAAEIGAVVAYLDSLGVPERREHALDFGCGVGRVSRALAQYFDHVVGVDIAESMIEAARRLNESVPNCEFEHNPKPDLRRFATGSFDFVYSNITLQHMTPRLAKGYLAEFVRVLSDDGLVLFQLPGGRKDESAPGAPRGIHRKLRHLSRAPIEAARLAIDNLLGRSMEMHCVPEPEVIDILSAAGGHVLDVQVDESAGPEFNSYRYAVIRASPSGRINSAPGRERKLSFLRPPPPSA